MNESHHYRDHIKIVKTTIFIWSPNSITIDFYRSYHLLLTHLILSKNDPMHQSYQYVYCDIELA